MKRAIAAAVGVTLVAGTMMAQSVAPAPPAPRVPRAPAARPAPVARVNIDKFIGRGYLGVSLVELTPELRQHYGAPKDAGVLVSRVSEDGPAGRAGIRVGDVITSIEGTPVRGSFEVGRLVRAKKGGEQVAIDLLRNGARQKYTATVAERQAKKIEIDTLEELPMIIGEHGEEIAERIEKAFNSPEFKAKMAKLRDCADSSVKIKALEKRLEELEKKLAKQ